MMRYAIALTLASLALSGCSDLTEPGAITIRKEPPPAPVVAAPAEAQGAAGQRLVPMPMGGAAPRAGG